MKYYVISDSRSIKNDVDYFKKHSIKVTQKDNGVTVMDVKIRLAIDEGMDKMDLTLVEEIQK